MPVFDDLVPLEAGDAERRLVAAIRAAAAAIPVNLPAQTWDPDRCPAAWLPVLADGVGIPCLDAAGRIVITPEIVRLGLALQREAGTQAGFTRLLAAAAAVATYTEGPAYRTARVVIRNPGALAIEVTCLVEWMQRHVRRESVHLEVVLDPGIEPRLALQVSIDANVVIVGPMGRLLEVL